LEPTKKKHLILLVDDEKIILEVVSEMLEYLGFKVLTAKNGHEAIDVYKKYKDQISLVILDMVMPYNGGKTFHALKAIDVDAKVILTSGYVEDRRVRNLLSQGAKGFIQKPFSLNTLKDEVTHALTSR
jgi:CheY-like chemotaxis protein